jgi:hypothetical protein
MDFVRSIIEQITVANLIVHAVLGVVVAFIVKMVLKAFNIVPEEERIYWIAAPLLVVLVLTLASAVNSEHPKLRAEINTVHVTGLKPNDRTGAVFILQATVYNAGSPSAISDWKLSVKSSRQTYNVAPIALTKDIRFPSRAAGQLDYMIYASESITDKTAENPITKGGAAKGVIAFAIPNVSGEDMDSPDTELDLSFRDISGRTVSTHGTRTELLAGRMTGRLPGFRSGPVATEEKIPEKSPAQ